jgi:hypothetical protein
MSLSSFIARVGTSPSWITDNAHFWFAYAVVLTSRQAWMVLPVILLALVKEFWFDAKFEVPKQTFADNMTDFLGYTLGSIVASLVLIYG